MDRVKEIVEANKAAGKEWNLGGYNCPEPGAPEPNPIGWLLNCQCETFWTPIMFSARYGHIKVVQYLAEQGAELEPTTTYNPLHAACFGQSIETVRYLVEEKAIDVNP